MQPQQTEPQPGTVTEQDQQLVVAAPSPAPIKRFIRQQVPDSILHNEDLNTAMRALPGNYNFEIHKTVWRIQQAKATTVALQFPEGLLMYACVIADLLEAFAGVRHALVLGDVTYGACCVDDFSAAAMGAELLVHYGHSCLVPVDVTSVPCLYVFVDIAIDVDHLVDSVLLNFAPRTRLSLAGTIQFSSAIQLAKQRLSPTFPSLTIPKIKPLSPGEVLGCTAPVLDPRDGFQALVFVADGRFHLEAFMIANPSLPAYRYDPYARVLSQESYDHAGMRHTRRLAVEASRGAARWGVILGTLGRQGNPAIVDTLQRHLASRGRCVTTMLLSEITPTKLAAMAPSFDAWVQVACPRLSIDWGEGFGQPTLTPYEALVSLGVVDPWWAEEGPEALQPYPMDYYSSAGGDWGSSYHKK
ncbi:MAG: hypothetical protein WDW38_000338 [Sanguina aurantia]